MDQLYLLGLARIGKTVERFRSSKRFGLCLPRFETMGRITKTCLLFQGDTKVKLQTLGIEAVGSSSLVQELFDSPLGTLKC